MAAPRIHLVSTLKNEGPYLVEWIAWYKTIGVTDFTLFSNDCTDGSNLMLDRLDHLGEIHHFDNPLGPRMDPQRRAYSHAGRMEAVRGADWVLIVDADEFVHVTIDDGTLPALLAACADAAAISLGWQPVGSGGARQWVDAPVTARFTRGGALTPPENAMVPGFKTLFRPEVFDYFGVHRPKFDKKKRDTFPKVRWVNGSGTDISERVTKGGWRLTGESAGYAFGRVNHYAVKSREEFLLKRLRGSANSKNEDRLNLDYWSTFDLNSTPLPPLNTAPLEAEMARLLADADLSALRRACLVTSRHVLSGQMQDAFARDFVGQTAPMAP
ncbi:MAG: glycosyltransferase family 2 protein [Pseudomonadota bacterium]